MSTPDTATAPEPSIDDDLSAVPATRRPLTVALGIMLLLGAIIAAGRSTAALAALCAATVLCGELSLGAAVVAEEWVDAHDRLGRNPP